ncbi:MAG: TetR/AcrR family transcriptional regulator [Planctomycetota bacterium]|jgi:AcrR family transcriptional regulator
MRVTADVKARTRQRILDAATKLFCREGFQATTTRRIAASVGIASGTLFNYFATKELLGMTLVGEAAARGRRLFEEARVPGAELAEDLFALITAELRELEPYRPFVGEVLEAAMSPFEARGPSPGTDHRADHLELAGRLLAEHGADGSSFLNVHLYWTLYVGVLAFWAGDGSPHQEDTLALLDRALVLFARGLQEPNSARP